MVTYENGLAMQEALVRLRQQQAIPDQLLLLTHPSVITLGRGGNVGNLVAEQDELAARGVRFFETTRGGDITWHGPGQIVGYPIVHLGEGSRDVRKYVTKLEEVLIRTAGSYGIEATRMEGQRGVWVGQEKLAAIGVRIARWVTCHGFALNVDPDLSPFELIIPCGLRGTGATSLAKLMKRPVDMTVVRQTVASHFAEVFGCEMVARNHHLRVVKVVVRAADRLLLLLRTGENPFWQPITGAVEPGESEREAAQRELLEETGLTTELEDASLRQSFLLPWQYAKHVDQLQPFENEPIFVEEITYVANHDSTPDIRLAPEEHEAFAWFSPDEALAKIRWTNDRESLEAVLKRNLSTA